jgi:acyl-CoA thioester hydrolase
MTEAAGVPDYPFWHEVAVRHSDLDPNDHVTNSVICAWFDDGRYILLRQKLRPLVEATDYFALVKLEMNFSKEVRMFHTPRVGTAITRIGTSSMAMRQHLLVDGVIAATATSVTVLGDGHSRSAKPLAANHHDALRPFLARETA